MKRLMLRGTLIAIVAGACCSVASGGLARWTDPNPTGQFDPVPNPDGTFTWLNPPWVNSVAAINETSPEGYPISRAHFPALIMQPGESRVFALDNGYNPNRFKRVGISFQYTGDNLSAKPGVPTFGAHPNNGNVEFVWSVREYLDNGIFFTYVINIGPQPDWETFTIMNTGTAPLLMTGIEISSICIPSPSSGVLFATGLLVQFAKRKRETAY